MPDGYGLFVGFVSMLVGGSVKWRLIVSCPEVKQAKPSPSRAEKAIHSDANHQSCVTCLYKINFLIGEKSIICRLFVKASSGWSYLFELMNQ